VKTQLQLIIIIIIIISSSSSSSSSSNWCGGRQWHELCWKER